MSVQFSLFNLYFSFTIYLGVSGENTEYYTGSMDEVRLYDKALTDAEVAALYQY